MKTRSLLVKGLLLLTAAAVWKFGLAPIWTQRLPPGWTWQADYIGIGTYPDPTTGEFPTENTVGIYERSLQIVSETERPRAVTIKDSYAVRDITTRQITWEYILKSEINPATGEHLTPEFHDQYLVFPRHVEKKTYIYRANYAKGIPLTYEREEKIEGVTTYLFVYQGRAEYTESYLGTGQYSGFPVEPGQEIKCTDDQFILKAWVEPLTGELLKIEESCLSGDYTYDIATGQKVAAVFRWAGTTAGDAVLIRADQLRVERARLLWLEIYTPLLLLGGGVMLMGVGVMQRLRGEAKT